MGSFPTITFKSLHLYSDGILLAQTRRKLNFTMDEIVVRDESADEPNDDGRRFRGSILRRDRVRGNDLARNESGNNERDTRANPKKHPGESSGANRVW